MVLSDSNKTSNENVVKDGVRNDNKTILEGHADENGNANENDISEDQVNEENQEDRNNGDGICFIGSLPVDVLRLIVDFALSRKS